MKEIIESQITLLSQTNKISLPVKISYTDNDIHNLLEDLLQLIGEVVGV